MIFTLFGLQAAASGPEHTGEPPEGHPCEARHDCPKFSCYNAECLTEVGCSYTRIPPTECCITSEECCEFAGEFETGICDKNCTCQFVPSLQFQCTQDSDCHGTRSGVQCRNNGPCWYPVCEQGWCGCIDGTGEDFDGDGEVCPPDCNDWNPDVCMPITCLTDRDGDGYPSCEAPPSPFSTEGALDVHHTRCRKFCVERGHTCPDGWVNPWDPHRWHKTKSGVSPDSGVPCTHMARPYALPGEEQPADVLSTEGGIQHSRDHGYCDCCDSDNKVYPGSPWTGSTLTHCGTADYDCSGGPATRYACCTEGMKTWPRHHRRHSYSSEDDDDHPPEPRYVWRVETCTLVTGGCGGCGTAEGDGSQIYTAGWACEPSCDDVLSGTTHPAEAEWACPKSCNGECVCVSEQEPSPQPGECARYVSHCFTVREDPPLWADGETCCVSTIA